MRVATLMHDRDDCLFDGARLSAQRLKAERAGRPGNFMRLMLDRFQCICALAWILKVVGQQFQRIEPLIQSDQKFRTDLHQTGMHVIACLRLRASHGCVHCAVFRLGAEEAGADGRAFPAIEFT